MNSNRQAPNSYSVAELSADITLVVFLLARVSVITC